MNNPTITRLNPESTDHARYRLEGGDLADGWEVREGRTAWCEVGIWMLKPQPNTTPAEPRVFITSFGGEVWPGAWPQIFTCRKYLGHSACYLTGTGESLFAQADANAVARRSPIVPTAAA